MSTIQSVTLFLCLMLCADATETDKMSARVDLLGDFLAHILRLERTVMELSWKLNSSTTRITEQGRDMNTCFKRLDELENQMKITSVTEGRNKNVAFEVRQMKDRLTLGDGEILKFDHVTLNAGNSYNAKTGNFIVPVDGTYLFWANVMSKDSGWFTITLQNEGREIARGYTGYQLTLGIATITHIVQLKKGDHVFFENEEAGGQATKIYGYGYSSYGGTLLCV